MMFGGAKVNGRRIVYESSDPEGLAALCARSWLAEHPGRVSDDSEYPFNDSYLSMVPESGRGKGVGLRTEISVPSGFHVGWVEGVLTRLHPDTIGEAYSFQLCERPVVYIDSGTQGSLVTLINEDVYDPNCVAEALVHRGRLRIRVTTNRSLEAGSLLSLSYRRTDRKAFERELEAHHWGRALTPAGIVSNGTRLCANRRYHAASPPPLTAMLCVECSEFFQRAAPFCCVACFASHVADHASSDPDDVLMCTPLKSNGSKPVRTQRMADPPVR